MARAYKIKTVVGVQLIADLDFTATTIFQDLLTEFTYSELLESDDLNTLMSNSNIITEDENNNPILSFGNMQAGSGEGLNSLETATLDGTIITPSTLNSDQDNYNPTGFSTCNMIRQQINGDRVITGFVAPPTGVNRIFGINNLSGTSKIKYINNDSSSLAANRLLLRDNDGDKSSKPNETAIFWYDHVSLRWRPYNRIG